MIIPFKAIQFAIIAHDGQRRKYTNEPYIVHPLEVAEMVSGTTSDSTLTVAALFHDIIEDTPYDYHDICTGFGQVVADLVSEVTNTSTPADGNRAKRKAIERERMDKASDGAKTIKLADIISNVSSIVEHDKDFAELYIQEKELMLGCLKGGNAALYQRAVATLQRAKEDLGYHD